MKVIIDFSKVKYHENTDCSEIAEDFKAKYGCRIFDIRSGNRFEEVWIGGKSYLYHHVAVKDGVVYDYDSKTACSLKDYEHKLKSWNKHFNRVYVREVTGYIRDPGGWVVPDEYKKPKNTVEYFSNITK